ncbi:MAG: LamG domain-containing protein [Armatimonadota bacterium]|nr:LamG domain-containing protein [Armatimonadota bacterium]
MPLLHTDITGLTVSGAVLGFAWTGDAPLLFDSANGKVALYFRGATDQFFVAYYDTNTARVQINLGDASDHTQAKLAFTARVAGAASNEASITVTDGPSAATCTVIIANPATGITETWNEVPRDPACFAAVLNGALKTPLFVAQFAATEANANGQVTALVVQGSIRQDIPAGATLLIGNSKVTVSQAVGKTEPAIAIEPANLTANKGDAIYLLEYDYETHASTNRALDSLKNGSLSFGVNVVTSTGQVQNGSATGNGAPSCQWLGDKPGVAFAFDAQGGFPCQSDATKFALFDVEGDVTLEIWVKPGFPGQDVMPLIHHHSDSGNYMLGLKQDLSALALDGVDDSVSVTFHVPQTETTHELWFKTTKADDTDTPKAGGGLFCLTGGQGAYDASIYLENGELTTRLWKFDPVEAISTTDLNLLADGQWHHVAHVYGTLDDGTKGQRLYVDGVLRASGILEMSSFHWQTGIIIGASPLTGSAPQFFKGAIDEVRVWDVARTAEQINGSMKRRARANEPGLIGCWRFNSGAVKDYSKNRNDGNVHSNPTNVASALPVYAAFAGVGTKFLKTKQASCDDWTHLAAVYNQSYALQFDGTTAYLDAGNDATLDISRDLTIEAFIRLDELGRTRGILTKGKTEDSTKEDVSYALWIDETGHLVFAFEAEGTLRKFGSDATVASGTFCKVAVTREHVVEVAGGAATAEQFEEIKLFIDSTSKTSRYTEESAGSNGKPLEIGKAWPNGGQEAFFKGALSEVRVWNTVVEPANICAENLQGREKGLVGWWRFEENTGNIAYDSKSNNHATLKGGASWTKDPNPNGSSLVLYQNGVAVPMEAMTATDAGDKLFALGACQSSGGNRLLGTSDEVRIWQVARTPEQIADNMFRHLLGEKEGLVAYYSFEDDTSTEVKDQSLRGNDLTRSIPVAPDAPSRTVLSTAPISNDAPQVRSALAGVKTAFQDVIASAPAVQEYGDLQTDESGNMTGILKRCYSFIKDGHWHLITGYKVGNLVAEWVGQVQFDPQLMGFIEGAPPVPSENLTQADTDYNKASAVALTEAEDKNYTYSSSKDSGFDMLVEASATAGFSSHSSVLVGAGAGVGAMVITGGETDLEETTFKAGVKTSFELTQGWLNDASVSAGVKTTRASKLELHGRLEEDDAARYPWQAKIGRRFSPANVGFALVQSETADVFALRLEHNGALVSYQMRPNPDIPKDWNIITFPLNPRYVKQGTLDGKIGSDPDPNYPNALNYSSDSSYFKPIHAYGLKNRIVRQQEEVKAYYDQYNAGDKGRSGKHSDLPQIQKRNLVNTYV